MGTSKQAEPTTSVKKKKKKVVKMKAGNKSQLTASKLQKQATGFPG